MRYIYPTTAGGQRNAYIVAQYGLRNRIDSEGAIPKDFDATSLRTTQKRATTRDEFGQIKRLAEIVVRTCLQASHLVRSRVFRREDEERTSVACQSRRMHRNP